MTELEKIAYAKSFIDKLANGINPLNDLPIPENDIANSVRLSRCFFYVSDILRQVIESGGISPVESGEKAPAKRTPKGRKQPFALTDEQRAGLEVSQNPLTAQEMCAYLNSIADLKTTRKINSKFIYRWLYRLGLLDGIVLPTGRYRRVPTPQGIEMGILTEDRATTHGGLYTVIVFTPQAQQFVFDNIEAIVCVGNERRDPSPGEKGLCEETPEVGEDE